MNKLGKLVTPAFHAAHMHDDTVRLSAIARAKLSSEPVGRVKSAENLPGRSIFHHFLVDSMTIELQNRQNISSPSRIFATILQVRQAPRFLSGMARIFRFRSS
jgi:hypothetical protein